MFRIVHAQIQKQLFQNIQIQSYIWAMASNCFKQINFWLLITKFPLNSNQSTGWECISIYVTLKLQNSNARKLKRKPDKENQLSKDILAFSKLETVLRSLTASGVWRRKLESRSLRSAADKAPVSCRGSFGNRSLEKELARHGLVMRTNPFSPVRPNRQTSRRRQPIYRRKRHIAWPSKSLVNTNVTPFHEFVKLMSHLNIEGEFWRLMV